MLKHKQVTETSRTWLRDSIKLIPDYKGPSIVQDTQAAGLRLLHLNESPYPPSPRAIEAVKNFGPSFNRYPDIRALKLSKALSVRTGIPHEQIIFGAGTDELVHLICQITIGAGDTAVMPWPTFPRYSLTTQIQGGKSIKVPLNEMGANDTKGLLASINSTTRTIWCCTPNPPSGGMMGQEELQELAQSVPENILLVVDEAYHEFGIHAGGPDILAIMNKRKGPWLVLRTFSKAYGLGALRIGYALCGSTEVSEALMKTKLQYNTNSLAQVAALAALDDQQYLEKTLDKIAIERDRLAMGLSTLGIKALPSAANFVSAQMTNTAAKVINKLAKNKILIRDWRDPDYLKHIRITVGLPDDTDAVISNLAIILREQNSE